MNINDSFTELVDEWHDLRRLQAVLQNSIMKKQIELNQLGKRIDKVHQKIEEMKAQNVQEV